LHEGTHALATTKGGRTIKTRLIKRMRLLEKAGNAEAKAWIAKVRGVIPSDTAAVSLNWKGADKKWLLTAFEKDGAKGTIVSPDVASDELTQSLPSNTDDIIAQPASKKQDKDNVDQQGKANDFQDTGQFGETSDISYSRSDATDSAITPLANKELNPVIKRVITAIRDGDSPVAAHRSL
ncbi:MAG: hypothetical protein R8K20_00750, partial [Gallionellaceae bacterium]